MMDSNRISSPPDHLPQRLRLPLRFRHLRVLAVESLPPGFVRVTFGGDDIEGFQSPGFDDHVKLLFPDPVSGEVHLPQMGPEGLPIWPDGERPVLRDYTPRRFDATTLVIDFVLHESGPATQWARAAKPGDWLGVGGPRGSMPISADFPYHLLIGDESALPAIARRLEQLPADSQARVLVEVQNADDRHPLSSAANLDVCWCHRGADEPGVSTVLLDTLRTIDLPDTDGFAWVACESKMARTLRLHLVQERGWHGKRVKAAGYWRRGDTGIHDTIED